MWPASHTTRRRPRSICSVLTAGSSGLPRPVVSQVLSRSGGAGPSPPMSLSVACQPRELHASGGRDVRRRCRRGTARCASEDRPTPSSRWRVRRRLQTPGILVHPPRGHRGAAGKTAAALTALWPMQVDADPRHLRLGDPRVHAQGSDQVVDLTGGHPMGLFLVLHSQGPQQHRRLPAGLVIHSRLLSCCSPSRFI